MAKAVKTLWLRVIECNWREQSERVLFEVRATKSGKSAEVKDLESGEVMKFDNTSDAYHHLLRGIYRQNPQTYFLGDY